MHLLMRQASLLAVPIVLAVLSAPAFAAPEQPSCVGEPSQTQLLVTVQNVHSSEGLIAVTIYPDDPDRFLVKHGSLFVERVPAKAPTTHLCVYVPGPGTYGVAVYHDADGNHKLNRTGLGMPLEGFGFSNNPTAAFGMPRFSEVRLLIGHSNTETRIRLTYP